MLIGGSALTLGSAETMPEPEVWEPIDDFVSALASGRGGGEVDALRSYGVRYVTLAAKSSRSIVPALDSEPGLRRLARAEGEVLWRISGVTSRSQVFDIDSASGEFLPMALDIAQPGDIGTDPYLDGALPEAVDVDPGSRVLWLGVTSTTQWSASIDGQSLARAVLPEPLNWAAAFVVPVEKATSTVVAFFDDSLRRGWLIFQAIVILALIVLALPERRVLDPDPDDPDRPDAPEVPHFLDLTLVATATSDSTDRRESMEPTESTSTPPTTPPTTQGALLEDSHEGDVTTKDASNDVNNDASDDSTGVNP
jgi:hypothetical protein